MESMGIQKIIINAVRNRDLVAFLGAGISINSGLPSAHEMVRYVLKKLGLSDEESEIILDSKLPFEAFIQCLARYSNINSLLNVFVAGEPNANHVFLAKLVKRGYLRTIVTTNFDKLIERALEAEGLLEAKDYHVLYRAKDWHTINWTEDAIRIIKIHGSVDDREDIAITLSQVASNLLAEPRARVITHVFAKGKHSDVLIMGYSCSDVFDLSPCIESLTDDLKRIFLIEHQQTNKGIEDIGRKGNKNPFLRFTGYRMFYPTDMLIKELWEQLFEVPFELIRNTTQWKREVDKWYRAVSKRYSRKFDAYFSDEMYSKMIDEPSFEEWAKQLIQEAFPGPLRRIMEATLLGLTKPEKENFWKDFLKRSHQERRAKYTDTITKSIMISTLFSLIGESGRAKEYSMQMLEATQGIDQESEMKALDNLGDIAYGFGEIERANEYYGKALKIAQDLGNLEAKIWIYSRLIPIQETLGNLRKKHEYIFKMLNLGQKTKTAEEGRALVYTAGLFDEFLGDLPKLKEGHSMMLKLARENGDKHAEYVAILLLGDTYRTLGEFDKLREYLEQALVIVRNLGDKQGERVSLYRLGDVLCDLGEYQKAEECFDQALMLDCNMNNKTFQAADLHKLGIVCSDLGKYQKTEECFDQALEIVRKLEDKDWERRLLQCLGVASSISGRFNKANEYFKQALEIAIRIGDNEAEKDLRRLLKVK